MPDRILDSRNFRPFSRHSLERGVKFSMPTPLHLSCFGGDHAEASSGFRFPHGINSGCHSCPWPGGQRSLWILQTLPSDLLHFWLTVWFTSWAKRDNSSDHRMFADRTGIDIKNSNNKIMICRCEMRLRQRFGRQSGMSGRSLSRNWVFRPGAWSLTFPTVLGGTIIGLNRYVCKGRNTQSIN